MKLITRLSVGIGDRFGRQGEAQLAAFVKTELQKYEGVVKASGATIE